MHLFRLFALLLLPFLAQHALAQQPAAPAAGDLRARLDGLAERKLAEAEQRAAQQALEQALAALVKAEEHRTRLETLKKTLEGAPRNIERARAEPFLTYPVGQLVGDMNADSSVRQVVQDMLLELAETKERLDGMLG